MKFKSICGVDTWKPRELRHMNEEMSRQSALGSLYARRVEIFSRSWGWHEVGVKDNKPMKCRRQKIGPVSIHMFDTVKGKRLETGDGGEDGQIWAKNIQLHYISAVEAKRLAWWHFGQLYISSNRRIDSHINRTIRPDWRCGLRILDPGT